MWPCDREQRAGRNREDCTDYRLVVSLRYPCSIVMFEEEARIQNPRNQNPEV